MPGKTLFVALVVALGCGSSGDGPTGNGGAGGGGGQGGKGGRGGNAGQSPQGGQGGGGTGGVAVGTGGSGAAGQAGAGSGGAPAGADAAGPTDSAGDTAGEASAPMANPFVYVGVDGSTQIRIFELDLASGALMARGMATSGPSPHYIAFHPTGKYLYAISEAGAGRIYAFSIDGSTGALTRLNDASSGGSGPAHLSMHKSGKWVLSSNYGSGHAAALPIMDDGRLGAPVMPRAAGAQAHMILDDGQSGKFVFVPSKGDNRTLQFKFDEQTGVLEPNTPAAVAQAGAPRHMTFHRSGRFAFLLTESGNSVVSYKYDPATGLLTDGARVDAAPSGNGAHILMHPSKEFLYASIRAFNSIAVFPVNAEGRLGAVTQVQNQISVPWDFDIDPSGRFLVVGNHGNNTVRVFRIDQQTGLLTVVAGGPGGFQPRTVAILRR